MALRFRRCKVVEYIVVLNKEDAGKLADKSDKDDISEK